MNETNEISDGYHTFGELHDHCTVLFIALMKSHSESSWYSNRHEDGTMFDGMFIAGMYLPAGQIIYHLENTPWLAVMHKAGITHKVIAPKWDGHNSADVVKRLKQWIEAL